MEDVFIIKDNFKDTENILSTLEYGELIDANFTLCIPIHGCGKYLKETLDSIANQKGGYSIKVQVLISDNKKYEGENPVIPLLRQYDKLNIAYYNTNVSMTQYDNFNRSIMLCRTEYMSMLHDDDLIVDNYFCTIEKLLPYLKKHNDIAVVRGMFKCFYDSSKVTLSQSKEKVRIWKITNSIITHIGFTLIGIPSCGVVFNREALINTGGYNTSYSSSGDAIIGGVLIDKGYKLYAFKNLTGWYRIANNTSLRLDVCKNFIVEDEKFRETWKTRKFFRRLYMYIFSNYIYSKNIDSKIANFSKFNKEITVEALDYKGSYKRYKKFGVMHLLHYCFGKLIGGFRLFTVRRMR